MITQANMYNEAYASVKMNENAPEFHTGKEVSGWDNTLLLKAVFDPTLLHLN